MFHSKKFYLTKGKKRSKLFLHVKLLHTCEIIYKTFGKCDNVFVDSYSDVVDPLLFT